MLVCFFQAEDGIRDIGVTGVQTCALPICAVRTGESLAARFAAKEAVAKALGAPGDLRWHDAEVTVGDHGRPRLTVRGTVARSEERRVGKECRSRWSPYH